MSDFNKGLIDWYRRQVKHCERASTEAYKAGDVALGDYYKLEAASHWSYLGSLIAVDWRYG